MGEEQRQCQEIALHIVLQVVLHIALQVELPPLLLKEKYAPMNPTSYGGNSDGQPPQKYQETAYASNQPGSNPGNNPYNPYGPPPAPPGAVPYDPYGVPPTVAANPPSSPANPYAPPPANPYPNQASNPGSPYPYPNSAPPANPYQNNAPPANPYPNSAPPANPYSYPGSSQPPAYPGAPPPPAPRGSNNNKVVLIVLAVLVVLGGVVGVIGFVAQQNQVASEHTNATATAGAGNKKATATAQVNATATAVVSQYPFSTNLKLSDPLKDNSKGIGWITDKGCKFADDGYHALEDKVNTYYTCPAMKSSYSDFTYQVSMKITQGDLAGISFRGNDTQLKYYNFVFRKSDGMYWLLLYTQKGVKSQTLDKNSTAYFNGSGTNQLGVVARGSKITLYVNGHALTSTTDSTFTSGQIGTVVYNGEKQGDTVEAVFSDAKLWQL